MSELVKDKKKNKITTMKFDGQTISDECNIANKFNKYVVNSVKLISDSIPNSIWHQAEEPVNVNSQFILKQVTIEEITNILKHMKNKSDIDKVSPRILLDACNVIGDQLVDLINLSI